MKRILDVAIVGGGPAGLRAAEVAAGGGRQVVIFDGKPSVGRKFLVAGKGGLNLTNGEDFEGFLGRYAGGDLWRGLLDDFSAKDLRSWCEELGIETFEAGTGRVYPRVLKGAPLLRRWTNRIKELGVSFEMKCLWSSLQHDGDGWLLGFENGLEVSARSVVFAMGGGSWPRTGSDGGWVPAFLQMGIDCAPLVSSNCGWECDWPQEVLALEGAPLKNLRVSAGKTSLFGELLLTRYGLEGGAIYALGQELRTMETAYLSIDFKPTFETEKLVSKMNGWDGDLLEGAQRRWRLSSAAAAIVGRTSFADVESLAREVKDCRVHLSRPRPLAEAISSAGGVRWSEVNENLMLKKFPEVFVAGEMLDWDAPTGGYLLQGSFATGTRVGRFLATEAERSD